MQTILDSAVRREVEEDEEVKNRRLALAQREERRKREAVACAV
jgi:hypothetical protein